MGRPRKSSAGAFFTAGAALGDQSLGLGKQKFDVARTSRRYFNPAPMINPGEEHEAAVANALLDSSFRLLAGS